MRYCYSLKYPNAYTLEHTYGLMVIMCHSTFWPGAVTWQILLPMDRATLAVSSCAKQG